MRLALVAPRFRRANSGRAAAARARLLASRRLLMGPGDAELQARKYLKTLEPMAGFEPATC
jgi:hypothetical protein